MPVPPRKHYTWASPVTPSPLLSDSGSVGPGLWYTAVVYGVVIQEVYRMTTARDRYEQKTKVVTFRVQLAEHEQIEHVKAKSGLSNADLIKLGAGIAQEYIKAKLSEMTGLEDRITRLQQLARQKEQELDEFIADARTRRMAQLDAEVQAFRLFDLGWGPEQAAFKLGVDHDTVHHNFRNWGEMRGKKEALERELLRECLREHIERDKLVRSAYGLFPTSSSQESMNELIREINYCESLLAEPDKIPPQWRAFLVAEYSNRVLADRSKKSPAESEPSEVEQAEYYLKLGYSFSQLTQKLGFKPGTVRQALARLRNPKAKR